MDVFASGVGIGRVYYTVLDGVEVVEWLRAAARRLGLGFARVEAHGELRDAVLALSTGSRRHVARAEAVLVSGLVLASPQGVRVELWSILAGGDGGVAGAGRLVSGTARGLHVVIYELPGHHEAWRLAQ